MEVVLQHVILLFQDICHLLDSVKTVLQIAKHALIFQPASLAHLLITFWTQPAILPVQYPISLKLWFAPSVTRLVLPAPLSLIVQLVSHHYFNLIQFNVFLTAPINIPTSIITILAFNATLIVPNVKTLPPPTALYVNPPINFFKTHVIWTNVLKVMTIILLQVYVQPVQLCVTNVLLINQTPVQFVSPQTSCNRPLVKYLAMMVSVITYQMVSVSPVTHANNVPLIT
jgi:hypothetical protein